jgi:hypothetical protein
MKHMTPLDAFNAAAGFSQQAMDFADERLRERAEIYLQHDALEETRESQLFLQTLQLTGDDDNLMGKWEEFRNQRRTNAENRATGIIRGSAYYKRAMGSILSQNETRMEAQVRGRQNELMQANGRATFIDNLELSRQINEGNPQAYIDDGHDLIRTALKNNYISYPESLRLKRDIYDTAVNGLINRAVTAAFKSGRTIDDIEEILAGIDMSGLRDFSISPIRNQGEKDYAETLRAKPSLTAEEADWLRQFDQDAADDTEGYEERQALLSRRNEGLLRAGGERAWQMWNTVVTGKQREADAQMSVTWGNVLTAVRRGDPKALDMIQAGLREVASFQNPFIDPDDRNKYNGWYNNLLEELGRGPREGGSGSIVDKIKNSRDYWIASGAAGRSSMEEARASYIQEMGELARDAGFEKIDEFERRYSNEIDFFGMYEDTKDALIKKNPGYAEAFRSLDVIINGWKGETKDPQNQALREQQGRRLAAYFFDTILDSEGEARMTPDQVQREILRLTGLLISDEIAFLRETVDNSNRFTVGSNSDRDFGRAIYEMSQHPWARFVVQGKAYSFGDAQYQQVLENTALEKFSTITGIPKANLSIGHSKEGMYDEAAELNIIVSGRGSENETYRFVSDARGNYHIERQIANGWQRDRRYTETAREAGNRQWWESQEKHAEAQRQNERENALRGRQATFEAIRNMPQDYDGQQHRLIQINALRSDMFNPVSDDDLRRAGISPRTGLNIDMER